jgi:hypothetical protein
MIRNISWILLTAVIALGFAGCKKDDITGAKPASLEVRVAGPGGGPLAGAKVDIFNLAAGSAFTDSTGTCRFGGLYSYETIVRTRLRGFSSNDTQVYLQPGSNRVDVYLDAVEPFREGFEAGSFSAEWQYAGDCSWEVSRSMAHTGEYSATSHASNYSSCPLSRMVKVDADSIAVSFWWRGQGYGSIAFYLDDNQVIQRDLTPTWNQAVFHFVGGQHTFRWYNRGSYSESRLWVDDLTVEPVWE